MWHTRVLGLDPIARTKELHHYDPDTGAQAVEMVQDVAPIIEDTKGRFNMVDERARWRDGFNHVASVPLAVIDKVRRESGINLLTDKAAMKQFLNDPDNRAFRTRPGRI